MGKSLETSKGSVWPLFLTTYAVLVERIENRLAQAGLPPLGWYDVLWGLERAPHQRLRMSELAQKVVVSRSNLTRLVDRLEDAGLVERERSEEDRRGAYAVLTESGQAVHVASVRPRYQGSVREPTRGRGSRSDGRDAAPTFGSSAIARTRCRGNVARRRIVRMAEPPPRRSTRLRASCDSQDGVGYAERHNPCSRVHD